MITEDYVSFETAKLLKEKGFDEECRAFYYKGILHETNRTYVFDKLTNTQLLKQYGDWEDASKYVMAPTIQMAMKWLREEHNSFIDIHTRLSLNADRDTCFSYMIQQLIDTYSNKLEVSDGEWLSYEECADAAIQCALKIEGGAE